MYKPLFLLGTIGFLSLAALAPAMARRNHEPSFNVNVAAIKTDSSAEAYTGTNSQTSTLRMRDFDDTSFNTGASQSQTMSTGIADASTRTAILANGNIGDSRHEGLSVNGNLALVKTSSTAIADSGLNQQSRTVSARDVDDAYVGIGDGNQSITTGGANASTETLTLVNVNTSGF